MNSGIVLFQMSSTPKQFIADFTFEIPSFFMVNPDVVNQTFFVVKGMFTDLAVENLLLFMNLFNMAFQKGLHSKTLVACFTPEKSFVGHSQ